MAEYNFNPHDEEALPWNTLPKYELSFTGCVTGALATSR